MFPCSCGAEKISVTHPLPPSSFQSSFLWDRLPRTGGAEAPAARLRFDIGILLPFWRFDRFFDMGLLRPDFTCVALIHHCGKKRACVLSECFAFLIHICVCFELRFRLALILLGFCVSHFYFRLGCLEKGKTKLGNVVYQLYCPFRTTQGVVGGMLLPSLCGIALWVLVSPLLFLYAFPSALLGNLVLLRRHAFTRTRFLSPARNIAKHNLETHSFSNHFSCELKVYFVQCESRME